MGKMIMGYDVNRMRDGLPKYYRKVIEPTINQIERQKCRSI